MRRSTREKRIPKPKAKAADSVRPITFRGRSMSLCFIIASWALVKGRAGRAPYGIAVFGKDLLCDDVVEAIGWS
jgi:hypothetical protein